MFKIKVSVRWKLHAEPIHGTHEFTSTREATSVTRRQHDDAASYTLVTQLHPLLPGDHLR
jgi:hypothetical protein